MCLLVLPGDSPAGREEEEGKDVKGRRREARKDLGQGDRKRK